MSGDPTDVRTRPVAVNFALSLAAPSTARRGAPVGRLLSRQGPRRVSSTRQATRPRVHRGACRSQRLHRPPRVSTWLQLLRRWSHEQVEQVLIRVRERAARMVQEYQGEPPRCMRRRRSRRVITRRCGKRPTRCWRPCCSARCGQRRGLLDASAGSRRRGGRGCRIDPAPPYTGIP